MCVHRVGFLRPPQQMEDATVSRIQHGAQFCGIGSPVHKCSFMQKQNVKKKDPGSLCITSKMSCQWDASSAADSNRSVTTKDIVHCQAQESGS